jgi:hypothetical protein
MAVVLAAAVDELAAAAVTVEPVLFEIELKSCSVVMPFIDAGALPLLLLLPIIEAFVAADAAAVDNPPNANAIGSATPAARAALTAAIAIASAA